MNYKKLLHHSSTPGWIFALCMLAFILLKMEHMPVPFFWDESGVYGKMIFELADQKLSLHPKAINEWISRGHPLLYPNLIAFACKLFGTTVTVAHAANFFLSCCLLVSMFLYIRKTFDPWSALVACVVLLTQPIFFTHSIFVLPEIALALMLWWTTWAFIEKKYWVYLFFGSAAVLIKEPAIVWICALLLWDLVFERKQSGIKILLWLTPLLAFGVFLIVQKNTFGWYFFPYHAGGFDLHLKPIFEKLVTFIVFLFWKQGRMIWGIIILAGIVLFLLKKTRILLNENTIVIKRSRVAIFASLIYIIFSSTTFYGDRYILTVFPYVTAAIGILLIHIIVKKRLAYALIVLVIMIGFSYKYRASDIFHYDNDLSYLRSVKSTQKTIQYMLENRMLNQDEFTATMPLIFALSDSRFGYLPKDTTARYSKAIHPGTRYAVQVIPGTSLENPDQYPLDTIAQWYDHDIRTIIYNVMPKDSTVQ